MNDRVHMCTLYTMLAGHQKIHYHACAEGMTNDFVGVYMLSYNNWH
jgi:hypothetical protein